MATRASPFASVLSIAACSALALLGPFGCTGSGSAPSSGFSRHLASASWKVGLYTGSSMSLLASENSALQAAGAGLGLQLYLNYGDFRNFEGSPAVGSGIADIDTLNANGQQLVLAFEPTNASFCTHYSITSHSSTGGCRMSDLTASAPNAAKVAAAYANIVALANALDQPLILRFGSEMNANWDDWDVGYDQANNSAQNFIAAWEFAHHSIVPKVAAGHSVQFAYAPNNRSYDGSTFAVDAQAFWPGSANVSIIGLDGYSTSNSFSVDFDSALATLESLGNQPMMLAEFAASTSVAGGREAWLDEAAEDLQNNHPRVEYMNWFDNDASHPYQLSDTDSTGQNLYKTFAVDLLNAPGSSGGSGGGAPDAGSPAGNPGTAVGNSCATTSDCTGGDATITEFCSSDGVCLTSLGADCSPGGAASDNLCNGGATGEQEVCSSSSKTCITGCHSDNDCPASASHCDTSGSTWSCVAPAAATDAGTTQSPGTTPAAPACVASATSCNPSTDTCCDGNAACQIDYQGLDRCCIADGNSSSTGTGSDCCSGASKLGGDGICGDASTAPVPQCIANGQASAAGDGSDCCTGTADYNTSTGICGAAVQCIADGQASVAGDGSDCCTGNFDPTTGLCGLPACIPDGHQSNNNGADCCSGNYDPTSGNCGTVQACVPDGQYSNTGDGSDCCSGQYDPNSGLCGAPACIPDGQQSAAGDGSDCCSGNYNPNTNTCGN